MPLHWSNLETLATSAAAAAAAATAAYPAPSPALSKSQNIYHFSKG